MLLVQAMTFRGPTRPAGRARRRGKMLETIAIVLIILWVLGFFTANTMGGLIHVLLVIAVVVLLIRVFKGRRI
jgi:hypothetical protein